MGIVLAGSLAASAASAGMTNGYDINRLLFQPHPYAGQMGSNYRPAAPRAVPGAGTSPAQSGAVIQPAAVGYETSTEPAADTPVRPAPRNRQQGEGGVWRLEYGNEDRGFLTNVFEPIFDPVFGGSPTDGGMTWGWRISYTPNSENPDWFGNLRPYLPWVSPGAVVRASYSLEQAAMTPSNLARADGRTIRPHAGFLAFDARVALVEQINSRRQRIDSLDLVAGLVGPASGARGVHEFVHSGIDEETDNWEEIKNEPIVNINYEYGQRLFMYEPGGMANVEFHPYVGAALGNALTYGSLGMSVRVGKNLFRDMGGPRQRLMLSGENFVEPGDYWAWNIFLGAEGRAVAHSVFLDGNLFRDIDNDVDSKALVYDVQMGFEAGYGAKRFSITNVYRSREFDGQQYTTEFVRLAASLDF